MLAGMLAAPALAQHVTANWIGNGEFDAGMDPWRVSSLVYWDAASGSPQAGSMQLEFFLSPPWSFTHARQCLPAPLPAPGPYRLSARLNVQFTTPLLMVQAFATPDCTGTVQQEVSVVGQSGSNIGWTTAQSPAIHFDTPPNSVQVLIRPTTLGWMWVDNVVFGPLGDYQTVVAGPQDNLDPAVAIPWDAPAARIVVFERRGNTSPLLGDLYVTRSDDDGASWTTPTLAVAGIGRDSHPALVQTGATAWSLFSHGNSSTLYGIQRASSADGGSFGASTPVQLGWPVNVEQFGPHVVRTADGSLTMTYWVRDQGSFLARSSDHGASWDPLRTQVGPGHSPRLAYRASDDTWLLVYVDGGLRVKTSQDPYDWSAPARPLVADPQASDPYPVLLADGSFAMAWSAPADGALQLFTTTSVDAVTWSAPIRHTHGVSERHHVNPALLDGVQPGTVELYWAAAQGPAADFDIVRRAAAGVANALFADGFEMP
jgi:hypothetical protein